MAQGAIELNEESRFDLAVTGEGFFQIETPQGVRYARAGTFRVDSSGAVVDPSGQRLIPALTVPAEAIGLSVDVTGNVSVVMPDRTQADIGKITLARFVNPGGLSAEGENLFAAGAAGGAPIVGEPGTEAFGGIRFGLLESSNTDVLSETVEQITDVRTFEANAGALKSKDQALGRIIDLRS